jgi:hypothetical protein
MAGAGWGAVLGAASLSAICPRPAARRHRADDAGEHDLADDQNETRQNMGQADAAGSVPWHFFDADPPLHLSPPVSNLWMPVAATSHGLA